MKSENKTIKIVFSNGDACENINSGSKYMKLERFVKCEKLQALKRSMSNTPNMWLLGVYVVRIVKSFVRCVITYNHF